MMTVILDTNAINRDFYLKGSHFKIFAEGSIAKPYLAIVPEVVIDEMVAHYHEDLMTASQDLHKAELKLSELLNKNVSIPLSKIEIEQKTAAYRTSLLERLKELDFKVYEYPNISHKEVVARDLLRRKPFKIDGSGYRDFLIWQNVRHAAVSASNKSFFITANSKDFGDGPDLHPELKADLKLTDIKICKSIKAFNDQEVLKLLPARKEIKKQLQEQALEFFDIHKWVKDHLKSALNSLDDIGSVITDYPPGCGSIHVSSLISIRELEVQDVFELKSTEKIVIVKLVAEIEVSISMNQRDAIIFEDARDFLQGDCDSATTWISNEVELGLNIILDSKLHKVNSYDIFSIKGEGGDVEYGPSYLQTEI